MPLTKLYIALIIITLGMHFPAYTQYSPAGGQDGSDAIYKTDSLIKAWATGCKAKRGFIDIADTSITYTQGLITSNRVFYGEEASVIGEPKGSTDVLSLGDGGSATVSFDKLIFNGDGADFVVFENAMQNGANAHLYFSELAFVEVSSDGSSFVRFPSVSLTQNTTQLGTFEPTDPTKIYNLAGKYTSDYGSPFDLNELKDSAGIDINNITYIRVVDVVGSIAPSHAAYDSKGNAINDPYPTPFWSGGFDLQAVGAINIKDKGLSIDNNLFTNEMQVFPNPTNRGSEISISLPEAYDGIVSVSMFDLLGKYVDYRQIDVIEGVAKFRMSSKIQNGIYLLRIKSKGLSIKSKLIIID